MNLAIRDIRHNLGRFLLTCVGLSLLLSVVLAMIGIYRGLVAEALTVVRAPAVDLWVVEAETRGPFAEASRIPGDAREAVARITGVLEAGSVNFQSVETEHAERKLRLYLIGYELGRPGGPAGVVEGRADRAQPLRAGRRPQHRAACRRPPTARPRDLRGGGADQRARLLRGRPGRLRHAAGFAEAAVRPGAAGRPQGARARQRRRHQRHRQRGDRARRSQRAGRRDRRERAPLEAPRRADAGRAGDHPVALGDRAGATPDRAVHLDPDDGLHRRHRAHHLHPDHRQDEGHRDAQADRRARPHHRRPDRAAVARHGGDRLPVRHHLHHADQGQLSAPGAAAAARMPWRSAPW